MHDVHSDNSPTQREISPVLSCEAWIFTDVASLMKPSFSTWTVTEVSVEDGALNLSCNAPLSSVSPETLPSTRTRAPRKRTGFGYVASTALTLTVHVPQSSRVFFFFGFFGCLFRRPLTGLVEREPAPDRPSRRRERHGTFDGFQVDSNL